MSNVFITVLHSLEYLGLHESKTIQYFCNYCLALVITLGCSGLRIFEIIVSLMVAHMDLRLSPLMILIGLFEMDM